jgi:hypothetical protein
MSIDPDVWHKSLYSNANGCVEVRHHNRQIEVRDAKLGDTSPVLAFTHTEWGAIVRAIQHGQVALAAIAQRFLPLQFTSVEWDAFLAGVRAGEFDLVFASRLYGPPDPEPQPAASMTFTSAYRAGMAPHDQSEEKRP